jgi:hypothetical protein
LERTKIEELLMVFVGRVHLQFFIKFDKPAVLGGNRQKMPEVCGDTVCDRLR